MGLRRGTSYVGPPSPLYADYLHDLRPLRRLLSPNSADRLGYDIVILSDLLHFHSSHDALVASLTSLLSKSQTSRAYVAAGKYTQAHVCDNFLREGEKAGLVFEEGSSEIEWLGTPDVSGLYSDQLAERKGMCRWWVGQWARTEL